MKILVTGASGYIGQQVVRDAIVRGHEVVALINTASVETFQDLVGHDGLRIQRCNLRYKNESRIALGEAVSGASAIIHLAAEMQRSDEDQIALAANGTKHILESCKKSQVNRLVLASSMSVYDYANIAENAVIDETSLVLRPDSNRDSYSRSKILQEELVKDFAKQSTGHVSLMRLGAVYGPKRLWTPRLGFNVSNRLWFLVGSMGDVPVCYVRNAARALLEAAESRNNIPHAVNVFDDRIPDRTTLAKKWSAISSPVPFRIVVPWSIWRFVCGVFDYATQRCPWTVRLSPSILNSGATAARLKPFRFTNALMHESMPKTAFYSFDDAMLELTDETAKTMGRRRGYKSSTT